MAELILTLDLRFERDVVQARQRAREIAGLLGFDHQEQIRIATATSEIARNAFRYAKGGKVTFSASLEAPRSFQVQVKDTGPGIPNLQQIFEGRYTSQTGMGMGILGTKRLMDEFAVNSDSSGTLVTFSKALPVIAPYLSTFALEKIKTEIAKRNPDSPFEEIQQQNVELMKTLSELRNRQEELAVLNKELEDTNRGVVALYAELEDRADYLRRTSELKSAFLSNMSHEFRTPLNSIISLTRMLGDVSSTPLTSEQQTEVAYIQSSARGLLDLVNDLLDMAKIEAGKLEVRPRSFELSELFGALRGMLKPLLSETSMMLVFEEPAEMPPLFTDEGKLSQILRNLISNAIKFTPKGEVRVAAWLEGENEICFSVADTGIGIAEADLKIIFKEFGQVANELQKNVRGTGLGLPLSQNLAELLGGSIAVESQPGIGSTFTLRILRDYSGAADFQGVAPLSRVEIIRGRLPVLVVEDNHETLFLYQSYLEKSQFQMIGTKNIAEARQRLAEFTPSAIVCDLLIQGQIEINFIRELREGPATSHIPILAVSTVYEEQRSLAAGATLFRLKPIHADAFLDLLHSMTNRERSGRILLIDDHEVSRYVLRQLLPQNYCVIREAQSGRLGLQMAISEKPDLIFLDLTMPDLDGYDVLDELKRNQSTSGIPVVIHTSQTLGEANYKQLAAAFDFFPKSAANSAEVTEVLADLLARVGIVPHALDQHV